MSDCVLGCIYDVRTNSYIPNYYYSFKLFLNPTFASDSYSEMMSIFLMRIIFSNIFMVCKTFR